MGEELRKLDREYFLVIYFNSHYKVINDNIIFVRTAIMKQLDFNRGRFEIG
jgi:DNA repair protein RadC